MPHAAQLTVLASRMLSGSSAIHRLRGPMFAGLPCAHRFGRSASVSVFAIHRFLELNPTNDSFGFQIIPGVVPNRGFNNQPDLDLYGLHYLQRVSDADRLRPRKSRRRDIRK
jgi:hypothetical protein